MQNRFIYQAITVRNQAQPLEGCVVNAEILWAYWVCMLETLNMGDGYLVILILLSAVRHSHLSLRGKMEADDLDTVGGCW